MKCFNGIKPQPLTPRPLKPLSLHICSHKFVHFDTKTNKEYFVNTGQTLWTRIDYFYCEKCLEEREKRRSETSRSAPEWY